MSRPCAISHVLLDIEGTTCPVAFVSSTLFPYARNHAEAFLNRHGQEPAVRALVEEMVSAWQNDATASPPFPCTGNAGESGTAIQGRAEPEEPEEPAGTTGRILPYVAHLIRDDIKLPAWKELQGKIWAEGYRRGELEGPLFADVPPALRRWSDQGLVLAVYSSGSVAAQQLLYGHSSDGDLRPLFSHWFDTRIGGKKDPHSYGAIADRMGADPARILFVSDSLAELQAAAAAGLAVLFSDRPGNPETDSAGFSRVRNFDEINPRWLSVTN
jgi:enolase-phosphatase E1